LANAARYLRVIIPRSAGDADDLVKVPFRVTERKPLRPSVRMSPAARQKDLVGQISSLNIISTTGPGRGGALSCETLCLSQLTGSDAANRLNGKTSHVKARPRDQADQR
jgi:hypothetical protein